MPVEERDASLAHAHRLDEPVTSRLHGSNVALLSRPSHLGCHPRVGNLRKCLGVSSALRLNAFSRRLSSTSLLLLLFAACSHQPPEDFAPDPGLVAQIRDVRITPLSSRGCPGSVVQTNCD